MLHGTCMSESVSAMTLFVALDYVILLQSLEFLKYWFERIQVHSKDSKFGMNIVGIKCVNVEVIRLHYATIVATAWFSTPC